MLNSLSDPSDIIAIHDPEINVDALMAQIRQTLLQRRAQAEARGLDFERLAAGQWSDYPSGRFRPELYDQLYLANLNQDKLMVDLSYTPSHAPFVGKFIEGLKRPFHTLILHYLRLLIAKLAPFNHSVVETLNELTHGLNQPDPQIAQLEQRLAEVERQLNQRDPAAKA
jgi:hypothetical protein